MFLNMLIKQKIGNNNSDM